MGANRTPADLLALTQETQAIWESKAAYWDQQMGEGNSFHRVLIAPAVEQLLVPRAGERILDLACGNGQLARQLAQLGTTVVAADFSPTFLERAQARTPAALAAHITYQQVDATNHEQLLALGAGAFDAIVCTMALMDMTTVTPLFTAVPQLLKSGGRFVFAVAHPCFNNNAVALALEEADHDGELRTTASVRVSAYLDLPPGKGVGMPGEPAPHYYFHRPLHELLGECFAAGLVLDGLAEPAFRPEDAGGRPLSWRNFQQIPPVLVARLRLL